MRAKQRVLAARLQVDTKAVLHMGHRLGQRFPRYGKMIQFHRGPSQTEVSLRRDHHLASPGFFLVKIPSGAAETLFRRLGADSPPSLHRAGQTAPHLYIVRGRQPPT